MESNKNSRGSHACRGIMGRRLSLQQITRIQVYWYTIVVELLTLISSTNICKSIVSMLPLARCVQSLCLSVSRIIKASVPFSLLAVLGAIRNSSSPHYQKFRAQVVTVTGSAIWLQCGGRWLQGEDMHHLANQ